MKNYKAVKKEKVQVDIRNRIRNGKRYFKEKRFKDVNMKTNDEIKSSQSAKVL